MHNCIVFSFVTTSLISKTLQQDNLSLWYLRTYILTPFVPGGGAKFAPTLSYFNIASKLKKSFALMNPDFELNLITLIFRKFGVSRTNGSDAIFAFVRGT